jgi:hypothetical protein
MNCIFAMISTRNVTHNGSIFVLKMYERIVAIDLLLLISSKYWSCVRRDDNCCCERNDLFVFLSRLVSTIVVWNRWCTVSTMPRTEASAGDDGANKFSTIEIILRKYTFVFIVRSTIFLLNNRVRPMVHRRTCIHWRGHANFPTIMIRIISLIVIRTRIPIYR